ncbi:Hypothetical_protein [Hexamita inflata]|uniref:Hypothetical_protein n=1 Tax=Hexamita inflata TaxID=28002 RepID=A0AA86UDM9_9EUKA|nr:Hypothetical protein HINF_LOCUS25128 [Hexamita inflata]
MEYQQCVFNNYILILYQLQDRAIQQKNYRKCTKLIQIAFLNVHLITKRFKLQKDDMVIIKRIHFKQNGKVLSDGIGIARARRASDPKGMPYMFIGAFELGETNFDGLVFWLRDPGDCIMMVE